MNYPRSESENGMVLLSSSRNTSPLLYHNQISELEKNGSPSSSTSSIAASTTSSILNPILIKDARTRSYLVGSIGSQDSLLGSEELFRHFPNGKVKILIISWNMSSNDPPKDLNDMILPEDLSYVPDIFAIGVQEAPKRGNADIRKWEVELQTTIGPTHVLLHSCSLGVLHISILMRRDLIWFCTSPEDASFNTRPSATNTVKTKGAIAISFCFFGTTFLFINSHLPAHENKMKERIEEYEKICYALNLPKNLLPLKPRYVSKDVTGRFDCVFWFGDLNFRVERPHKEVIQMLKEIHNQPSPSMECLLSHDQLIKTMELGNAFKGFSESSIHFFPSYKFKVGTKIYDHTSQRVPSFTDRILYRSKRPNHIECLRYDAVSQVNTSDHKPVFALMQAQLRPGRDLANILNAGNFNREVYIEALKRRACDDPDDPDREARRASIVCTIS